MRTEPYEYSSAALLHLINLNCGYQEQPCWQFVSGCYSPKDINMGVSQIYSIAAIDML